MSRFLLALAVASVAGLVLGVALAPAGRRPASRILAEHDAVKLPGGFLDDEQVKELERACRRRCALDQELLVAWPDHARAPALAGERWAYLENTFGEHDAVLEETARVLSGSPSRALAGRARYARAWSALGSPRIEVAECLRLVDEARAAGVNEEYVATMLLRAAQERTADPELQRKLCARIADDLPRAVVMKKEAQEWESVLAHVGRPLELDFVDPATGRDASLARWSGHPVLVHVRRASDWKPLPESALVELEQRWSGLSLVAVQVVIGVPDSPAARPDHRIVAPLDDPRTSWEARFGIRKTPAFLLIDANGRVAAVSQRLDGIESRLR
jgi:hypothetical protein